MSDKSTVKSQLAHQQLRPEVLCRNIRFFDRIDGRHSFKEAVPEGYVDYQVRTRHGGQVVFFNFKLAKEMGLIPDFHPEKMNERLSQEISRDLRARDHQRVRHRA